jgi:hypothetical protein
MNAIVAAPCGKCPFRKDVPIYLRADRRRDIAESLLNDDNFYCHNTTVDDPDDDGDRMVVSDSQICAGAAKALMMSGGSTNLMRIAERLGLADLDKTEERGVEVWSLDQWPRLAEGSTGDEPEWEVGDEDGVETCSYVGDYCEAPAGFLGAGGGVVRGTVAAELQCSECGDPLCGECITENGMCPFCDETGDEDDE